MNRYDCLASLIKMAVSLQSDLVIISTFPRYLDILKIISWLMRVPHIIYVYMCNLCPEYGSSAGSKRGATNGGRLYMVPVWEPLFPLGSRNIHKKFHYDFGPISIY